MALKGRLLSKRSKRFGNVEKGNSPRSGDMNFSSTDSEPEDIMTAHKVREKFSSQKVIRGSGRHIVDNDHIYSSTSGAIENTLRKNEILAKSSEKCKRKRCFSKNAVMARLNRERKKKYVSSLEFENDALRKENARISEKLEEENEKMSVMKEEILYLRGLLANSKELGLILRNLKEVTGLPVTSSIVPKIKTEIVGEILQKSPTAEGGLKNLSEYHPRVRSSYNYPILKKDINLGSCLYKTCDDVPDLECPFFHLENDTYDIFKPNVNEGFLDFNQSLDSNLEDCFKGGNISKQSNPEVGICLHVNQKTISVEFCSVCNSKATTSIGGLPNSVLIDQ